MIKPRQLTAYASTALIVLSLACAGRAGRGGSGLAERAPDWLQALGDGAAIVVAIEPARFTAHRPLLGDAFARLDVRGIQRAMPAANTPWAAVRLGLTALTQGLAALPEALPGLDATRPIAIAAFEPTVSSVLEYCRMTLAEGFEPGFRHRVLLPATDAPALLAALEAALQRAGLAPAADGGFYEPGEDARLRLVAQGQAVRLDVVAGLQIRLPHAGPPAEGEVERLQKRLRAWAAAAVTRDVPHAPAAVTPAQLLLAEHPGAISIYVRGERASHAAVMLQAQKGLEAVGMVAPEMRDLILVAMAGEIFALAVDTDAAWNELADAAATIDIDAATPLRLALSLSAGGRRAWDAALVPRGMPPEEAVAPLARLRLAADLAAARAELPATDAKSEEILRRGGAPLLPYAALFRPLASFWAAAGSGGSADELAARLPFAATLTLAKVTGDRRPKAAHIAGAAAALFARPPRDLRETFGQMASSMEGEGARLEWALEEQTTPVLARVGLNVPLGKAPQPRKNDGAFAELELDLGGLRRSLGARYADVVTELPAILAGAADKKRVAFRWERRDAALWGQLWLGDDATPAFTAPPATSWVPPVTTPSVAELCLRRALLEAAEAGQAIAGVDPSMRARIVDRALSGGEAARACARKDAATRATVQALDAILATWRTQTVEPAKAK